MITFFFFFFKHSTVLTNPPFGTKSDNGGIDLQFLRTATRLARRAVYSFHKRSTRTFVLKTIQEDWGYEANVAAEMSFGMCVVE
jgi:putative methylase